MDEHVKGKYEMTEEEKSVSNVLIVEPNPLDKMVIKSALLTLGFRAVTDAPDHDAGLKRFQERRVTHVFFAAAETNMPAVEFLRKILRMDSETILIATSMEPQADDVFTLFQKGAKGFLRKPATTDTVEDAILSATKGEPISEKVLFARDRNEAFATIMAARLDKVADTLRQAERYSTAEREVPKALANLRNSSDIAQVFSEGGIEGMLETIQEVCVERSNGPATRLGRLRHRLKERREGPENPKKEEPKENDD